MNGPCNSSVLSRRALAAFVWPATVSLFAFACSNGGELATGGTTTGEPNAVQSGGNTDVGGGGGNTPTQTAGGEPNAAVDGNATTPATAGGNVAGFRLIGRVPADGSQTLSWSASGGEFAFAGTEAHVHFTALSGNNVVGIFADGNRVGTSTLTAASPNVDVGPLSQGNHVVQVLKTSEARLGTLAWGGYATDGQPQPLTAPSRRIAFLGDSIAAGYGVNGNAPCTNTAQLEDGTKSFAYLAAQALGADASLMAWAGKGLTRNDTTDNSNAPVLLPALWRRANGADATSTYAFGAADAPQVVVLAMGTNDFEYMDANAQGNLVVMRPAIDHNAFVAAYVAFVQQVAASYPAASFVLCSSPLLSDYYPTAADAQHSALLQDLQQVASQTDATKVWVLDLTLTDAQRTGCGAHPNAAGQQSMATQLASFVRQKMGW